MLNQLDKLSRRYNKFLDDKKEPYLSKLDKKNLTKDEREKFEDLIHQYVVIKYYNEYEQMMDYFFNTNSNINLYIHDI